MPGLFRSSEFGLSQERGAGQSLFPDREINHEVTLDIFLFTDREIWCIFCLIDS